MSSNGRLLIVEDEPSIREMLAEYLGTHGYEVVGVDRGTAMREAVERNLPDVVLLDVNLPGEDGLSLARFLRERFDVGIIMVTGAAGVADRVAGLEVGADDYVTKPFSIGELIARIKAIFRRLNRMAGQEETLKIGPAEVNIKKHTLLRRGKRPEPLTFYEVELLKLLHERAEQPVSRDEILDKIWGVQGGPTNRTVDNFIVKLRRKIESQPDKPQHILTVYGFGYKLVP